MSMELLTVAQVAAAYGFRSQRAVRNLIERRQMPHRKIGRAVYVPRDELEAYLDALPGLDVAGALATINKHAADAEARHAADRA